MNAKISNAKLSFFREEKRLHLLKKADPQFLIRDFSAEQRANAEAETIEILSES